MLELQTLFKKSWTLDSYGGRTIHSRTTVLRNALLVAPLRKENPLNAMLRQGVVRLVSYLSTIVGLKITTLRVALIGTNRYYVTNAGKGHKRTDCLLKVNGVATYNKTKLLSLDGAMGGKKCKLTLDYGTQLTVINESLVKKYECTGDSIKLVGFAGGGGGQLKAYV